MSSGFPVFVSPSTPARASRIMDLLSRGPWCKVVLPAIVPADLELAWDGHEQAPVEVRSTKDGQVPGLPKWLGLVLLDSIAFIQTPGHRAGHSQ